MPKAFGPPEQSPEVRLAIRAWNLMGAELNWQALPIVADLLGFEDIEGLVDQMLVIREHQRETQ